MKPEHLVTATVEELFDQFMLPGHITSVEEETMLLSELLFRKLTIGQRVAIRRKMTERRRLYNYQCIMALVHDQLS
ncbi:MAG: hypothetical protein ACOYUK_03360 [Patescibacteria group bacterium]